MSSPLIRKLHDKLGDFWFYSLMLFFAMRAADLLNVVVGLYLVPKYVGPRELGAVMPLVTFSAFLALPAAVFATVFLKEVNRLATERAFGQMKSLIRGVFAGFAIFLVLAIVVAKLVLPLFLERIRVVNGSLGVLIIATGFVAGIAPVYSNALQALKKFRTLSVISIIGAPARLLAMLLAMPFRALSGYFIGQMATPAVAIAGSVVALRQELFVKSERYWTRPVFRRFSGLFVAVAAYQGSLALMNLVENMILRQRLPELDSAAYYMVSRFSDIATFLTSALAITLFPYTAELAEQGRSTRPLVLRSSAAIIAFAAILAVLFGAGGRPLLSCLPDGEQYAPYFWAIPWLVMIVTLQGLQVFHLNTEISAGRFGFLKWWVPVNFLFAAGLLFVTGHGYFTAILPASWNGFLATHTVDSLSAMLGWMTAQAVVKFGFCLWEFLTQNKKEKMR